MKLNLSKSERGLGRRSWNGWRRSETIEQVLDDGKSATRLASRDPCSILYRKTRSEKDLRHFKVGMFNI